MAICIQYDLFEALPSAEEVQNIRMDQFEEKLNNHCRSFHAKLGALGKIIAKQDEKIERLEQIIYKLEIMK